MHGANNFDVSNSNGLSLSEKMEFNKIFEILTAVGNPLNGFKSIYSSVPNLLEFAKHLTRKSCGNTLHGEATFHLLADQF